MLTDITVHSLLGLLFHSYFGGADAENQQARFMDQIMPAAYYLAVLAIENIWRSAHKSKKIHIIQIKFLRMLGVSKQYHKQASF
jgi:hypothetical protein